MTSNPRDRFQAILTASDHPSVALARHSELAPVLAPDGSAAAVTARRKGTILVPLGPLGGEQGSSIVVRQLLSEPSTKSVVMTQVRESNLAMLRGHGFKSEVFGRSYSIHLPSFVDRGKALAKVRQNVNRATRDGVTVREVTSHADVESIVAAVSKSWIRQKGFHTKKLKLLVGEDTPILDKISRTFVAYCQERAVAFVTYSAPDVNSEKWLYDLTRRTVDAPVGTIEAINMHAIRTLVDEKREWLHLGLTPFIGIEQKTILDESVWLSRLMRLLARHGNSLYPALTQERFKLKWNPHVIEPEFISVYPDVSVASLYNLMRLTNII